LVGCQSEKLVNDGGSQGGQQFSLTASKGAKGVGSRTAILDGKTIWSEDDKIYVSSEDGRVTGVLKLDPNSLSEDKTTATFTGFVFGDPAKLAYSVFPAPTNGTIIDLSTIEGGKEVDAPFIGKIDTSEDVDVRFDHVCGVAPVIKNNYQGGEIAITATNDNNPVKFLSKLDVTNVEFINGKPEFIIGNDEIEIITITSPKGGQMYVPYYLKSTLTANGEGKKIVEFKHGNDVVNNADLTDGFVGKVHATTVVAHTMKEDGTTVQNTSTESTLSADEKTALVDQNQFSSINSEESATSEETQYFNVSGLVEKTEEGKTQNVVAEAVEVTLPKVEVTEENKDVEKSVEISFTNVTSSTTITIQEEESTSGSESNKSIDNLTVVLPSATTVEEAKEAVNINMPNTTVTVKSNDGNVLFIKEMTVATADNTLVVGADVEIKSLTIKKGNVQVFGKVGEIKRDGQNKDDETVVIIEKGGIVNSINGKDEISVVDKNKGDVQYFEGTVNTFKDLQDALKYQGGYIEIGSNFTITAPLTNSGEFEVNMQGHTLTIAEGLSANVMAVIINNNHLHVYNGTFQANSSDIKYFIHNKQDSSFEINGVDIMAGGMQGGILNDGITVVSTFKDKTSTIKANGFAIINSGEVYIEHGIIEGNVENLNRGIFEIEQGNIIGNLTTSSPEGIVTIGEGVVIKGNNWPGGTQSGDDEGSEEEGEPVANLEQLTAALDNPDVQNILLTAPITLTESLFLNGKNIEISSNVFTANNAAITIDGENVGIIGDNGEIKGSFSNSENTTNVSKYLVYSQSDFYIENTDLVAEDDLHAVRIENGSGAFRSSSISTVDGHALYMLAETSDVYSMFDENSTVTGDIYYYNDTYNWETLQQNMSCIIVNGKVNGNLNVDGAFKNDLRKNIGATAQIGDGFTGWPKTKVKVSKYEELVEYLNYENEENRLIKEITIIAPITITTNDYLELGLGDKTIIVDDAVWDIADAAITITTSAQTDYNNYFNVNFNGVDIPENRGVITGSTTKTGKYLIKSTSVGVGLNGITIQVGDALNAIYVENVPCYLSLNSIITSDKGNAIDIKANPSVVEVNVNGSSQVNGIVRFLLHDFQAVRDYQRNCIIVDNGFVKTVVVEGQPVDVLNVNIENGGTIQSIKQGGSGVNVSPFYKQEWE